MIAQGATATMEAWSPKEKPNASFSHPWCSGASSVIIRHLLGVRPLELGWARTLVMPQISSLRNITAKIATKRGELGYRVVPGEQSAGLTTLRLSVRFATRLKLCLPPPHGAEPSDATTMTVNGAATRAKRDKASHL
jgi:hypothetical protein